MATNLITPREFLDAVSGATRKDVSKSSASRPIRLATIDPDYTSGDPRVIFDGEATLTQKTYVCASYTPSPGDRVVMVPIGHSYVIIGALGEGGGGGVGGAITTLTDASGTTFVNQDTPKLITSIQQFTTTVADAKVFISATYDVRPDQQYGSGDRAFCGGIQLNGSELPGLAILGGVEYPTRVTCSQTWTVTMPTPGTHEIRMSVRLGAGTSLADGSTTAQQYDIMGTQTHYTALILDF